MNAAAVLGCVLTVAAYAIARALQTRFPLPITNPVVVATPLVIGALIALEVDYPAYRSGGDYISALLMPATVALGLPLYRHRAMLVRYSAPAAAGLVVGGICAIVSSLLLAHALSLAAALYPVLAVKSATAPIALQIGSLIGTDPGLCAVFAIATGMTGALLGSFVLSALGVVDPVARGLAYGTISHGIATAQACAEGELPGAVSGVAMGCAAVFVSLAAPPMLRLLV